MPLAWLLTALDGYALAAVATKQMTFAAVMMHKHWVREVAAGAPADVDSGLVAAVYDELVRRVSSVVASARPCACPRDYIAW